MKFKIKPIMLIAAVLTGFLIQSPLQAEIKEGTIGFGGGGSIFIPFEGPQGHNEQATLEYAVTDSLVIGGSLKYKQLETSYFDVKDTKIESYSFLGEAKYLIGKNKVQPYFGFGLGYGIFTFDQERIEKALSQKYKSNVTLDKSFSGSFLFSGKAGIDYSITKNISIFGEIQVEMQLSKTEIKGESKSEKWESFSGVSPMLGMMLRF